ncbi:MAG: hypothetical protein M1812_007239 [Candelaria pacifica]|nr:MAG: hypothetical protein M1812_007239 [Candelaria pacifica]
MAYNALAQREQDVLSDETNASTTSGSPPVQRAHRDFSFQPLTMDFENLESIHTGRSSSGNLSEVIRSGASIGTSYDMLEDDDYDEQPEFEETSRAWNNAVQRATESKGEGLHQPYNDDSMIAATQDNEPIAASYYSSSRPMMRIASSEGSVDLRHPTPDLQSLQGGYVENVERLERSAERLSMGSDIGEELRKMKLEQKRSESRQSSVLGSPIEEGLPLPPPSRQFSSTSVSNSIVGINSAARSGGYSPAGYVISPKGSVRSGSYSYISNRGRSTSRGSKLTQLPEPNQEGRPLDSFSSDTVPVMSPPKPPAHAHLGRDQNGVLHAIPQQYYNLPDPPNAEFEAQDHIVQSPDQLERPGTAASNDTYQQAKSLFVDFDGVHYDPEDPESPEHDGQGRISRRTSLVRPSGPTRPQSYIDPLAGQSMVYYPAPVPAMLNLPKRLSKLPSASQREQRRSQILETLPDPNRKSAAWLPGLAEDEGDAGLDHDIKQPPDRHSKHFRHSTNDLSNIPSQLRASAFFDRPGEKQQVEVKDASAVATLDSILDASAYAPVTAFTDHPIAGHVGHEVYGRQMNRRSTADVLNKADNRKSTASTMMLNSQWQTSSPLEEVSKRDTRRFSLGTLLERRKTSGVRVPEQDEEGQHTQPEGERTSLRQAYEWGYSEKADDQSYHDSPDHERNIEAEIKDEVEEEEAPTEEPEFFGAPTTLLAELQLRKQQQKQRNRTAATAFPNGMHSTLLELDAVAQVQKKARQNKRTALAWEDPNVTGHGSGGDDDEDVPLGVLFPGRTGLANKNNPRGQGDQVLGLMESREIEDNEPLSRRRARLRTGAPITRDRSPARPVPSQPTPSEYQLEVAGVTDVLDEDEDEGETLAQRTKRLKGKQGVRPASRAISAEFATEMMSQLGGDAEKPTVKTGGKLPEPEEETLGQRRKRLQAEREAKSRVVSGESGTGTTARPEAAPRRNTSGVLQPPPALDQRQASHYSLPLSTPHIQHEQGLPANCFSQGMYNNGMMFGANGASLGAYGAGPPGVNMGMGMGVNAYGGGPMGYSNPALYNNNAMAMNRYGPAMAYTNPMFHSPSAMTMGGYGGVMPYGNTMAPMGTSTMPFGQAAEEIDPRQRAMIDQWRQSVMH